MKATSDKIVQKPVQEPGVQDFSNTVKQQVLELLGKPDNLHGIIAHRVGDNYRVNVRVTTTCSESYAIPIVTMPHSYYIRIDSVGKIVYSNPIIKREYGVERREKQRKTDNLSSDATQATSTIDSPKPI